MQIENSQKKAASTPTHSPIENTQQNINEDNHSSPDIQKKGNNTIIKLQPIKLLIFDI